MLARSFELAPVAFSSYPIQGRWLPANGRKSSTVPLWRRAGIDRNTDVTLYSRPGCHLCEDAEARIRRVLGKEASSLRVVNILEDRELEDQYVFRIPVLRINGVDVAEGEITEAAVRKALRSPVVSGGHQ